MGSILCSWTNQRKLLSMRISTIGGRRTHRAFSSFSILQSDWCSLSLVAASSYKQVTCLIEFYGLSKLKLHTAGKKEQNAWYTLHLTRVQSCLFSDSLSCCLPNDATILFVLSEISWSSCALFEVVVRRYSNVLYRTRPIKLWRFLLWAGNLSSLQVGKSIWLFRYQFLS